MWFLRKIAWPIAVLYGLVVSLRNWCYDTGIFSSKSYKTPTICVGNLSVGGTGKTPMIEYLLTTMQNDYKMAVLSRGYKRKSIGFVLADAQATVGTLGDEPFQLYRKFKDIGIAVDRDRQHGMSQLETLVQPEIVLLDDAFQHRRVTPGLSILLTTYQKLFVDDYYLPTGTLRDSKKQAKRAQLVVVTKCPKDLGPYEKIRIEKRLAVKVPVLFAYFEYSQKLTGPLGHLSLAKLPKKEFALVTGIANPLPLVSYLKRKGLDFVHLNFADHHNFTAKDLKNMGRYPFVLTTEKDRVRLDGKLENLYSIGVRHVFLDGGKEKLAQILQDYLKPLSQS